MNDGLINSFVIAVKKLGFVMKRQHLDATEIRLLKKLIQGSYSAFNQTHVDCSFFNYGLWDKKINKEFQALNLDLSKITIAKEVNSPLLLYFLIRPLVKMEFFNKRLLEVGCGNGIGLKLSSEILKPDYALGIDLVSPLVKNATRNFYQPDKVNYIQSDAENLPVENESFDIVTNLESSHLYPQLENFFSEVERVLVPGGYFCYSDLYYKNKDQSSRLEQFVKKSGKLKIIKKINITKRVQASLYRRLIENEELFYQQVLHLVDYDESRFETELATIAAVYGVIFLPWWKIKFKNPVLRSIVKVARKDKFWGKKYYFYYLVQKVG